MILDTYRYNKPVLQVLAGLIAKCVLIYVLVEQLAYKMPWCLCFEFFNIPVDKSGVLIFPFCMYKIAYIFKPL